MVQKVGQSESQQDHIADKVDQAQDERGDPFPPTEKDLGFEFFKVEVDLLENVCRLERNHV